MTGFPSRRTRDPTSFVAGLESFRHNTLRAVRRIHYNLFQQRECDVLKEYGVALATARRQYRAYVNACVLEDDAPLLEAMTASRHAVGGSAFVEKTERAIEARRDGRLQNEDLDLPRWMVAVEEIDRLVAHHYGVDEAALKEHGHRAGVAKAVAVELACRLSALSGRAIGEHYCLGSGAVSAIHRKVQKDWRDVLPIINSLALRLQRKRVRRNR